MNEWFYGPRVIQAEVDVYEAQQARRHGDMQTCRARYSAAAEAYAETALAVPDSHPYTRKELAIAAVEAYVQAGYPDIAAKFARRMLHIVLDPSARGLLDAMHSAERKART